MRVVSKGTKKSERLTDTMHERKRNPFVDFALCMGFSNLIWIPLPTENTNLAKKEKYEPKEKSARLENSRSTISVILKNNRSIG